MGVTLDDGKEITIDSLYEDDLILTEDVDLKRLDKRLDEIYDDDLYIIGTSHNKKKIELKKNYKTKNSSGFTTGTILGPEMGSQQGPVGCVYACFCGRIYTENNSFFSTYEAQIRSSSPKTAIITPSLIRSQSPSISNSLGLSYEDAKKQTIKRFMNQEITRDECLKLLMDLKVQYER